MLLNALNVNLLFRPHLSRHFFLNLEYVIMLIVLIRHMLDMVKNGENFNSTVPRGTLKPETGLNPNATIMKVTIEILEFDPADGSFLLIPNSSGFSQDVLKHVQFLLKSIQRLDKEHWVKSQDLTIYCKTLANDVSSSIVEAQECIGMVSRLIEVYPNAQKAWPD